MLKGRTEALRGPFAERLDRRACHKPLPLGFSLVGKWGTEKGRGAKGISEAGGGLRTPGMRVSGVPVGADIYE